MKALRGINQVFSSPFTFCAACWWFVLGKKVRAQNRFRAIFSSNKVQVQNSRIANAVCEAHAKLSDEEIANIHQEIEGWKYKPLISIVMPVYNTDENQLLAAIASVRQQIYQEWELCIADDCSTSPHVRAILETVAAQDQRIKLVFRATNGHICAASNSALEIAEGPFVAFMDHDDLLPIHALFYIAKEILLYPDVDLIYSDEDKIREDGRLDGPHFKPDWNEELFLAQNYLNHLSVYRRSLLQQVGGLREGFEGSQDHDLALRVVAKTDAERIRHIPKILYHWRAFRGSGSFSDRALAQAIDARQRAVRDYLASIYPENKVAVVGGPYGCNRLYRELPAPPPHVTLIIPTRDRLSFLKSCLETIFNKTAYPSFDVLVVDNESVEAETLNYLKEVSKRHPVSVIPAPGEFNYSALNNLAVSQAKGDVIALLNNDVEVISSEWLREMVCYAVMPHIGAVGARLLYDNGLVQHAGIILGTGGIANHAFHGYPAADSGYQARLQLPQYVSAVTGACLVVEKKKYLSVGGLDEKDLKVAYNDVDLCLKLSASGLHNVYTPYANLIHHESVSRGRDISGENAARLEREGNIMRDRWGDKVIVDKYYSKNFSENDGCFKYKYI